MKKKKSKYSEEYIAFASFNSKKVIAHGKDVGKVIEEARKKGASSPVIMWIRDPNKTYIFMAA